MIRKEKKEDYSSDPRQLVRSPNSSPYHISIGITSFAFYVIILAKTVYAISLVLILITDLVYAVAMVLVFVSVLVLAILIFAVSVLVPALVLAVSVLVVLVPVPIFLCNISLRKNAYFTIL